MLKRLPYLILALLVGISSSVLFGGKVRASAPVFYDGTVTWAVGRRLNSSSTDFDYSGYDEQLPVMRSSGLITDELGGIPWTAYRSDYTQNLPAYVAIHSRELCENGGYVYLGFAYGYGTNGSIANVSLTAGNLQSALYVSGSVDTAIQYGTQLTASVSDTSIPNTYISGSYAPPGITNPAFREFTSYDGTNFAKQAYFLSNSQELGDLGIYFQTIYDYGTTASGWNRTRLVVARITVPSYQVTGYNDRSVVWVKLDNVFRGSFHSLATSLDYSVDPYDTPQSINARYGSIVYLLPVYCYATSTANYEDIEAYLTQILAAVQQIPGSNQVPASVLESYASMASQARAAAEQAVRDMSVASPTFGTIDPNVFGQVDTQSKNQFVTLLSFLRLDKILPIVLAVFVLSLIAYVFFGKKG